MILKKYANMLQNWLLCRLFREQVSDLAQELKWKENNPNKVSEFIVDYFEASLFGKEKDCLISIFCQ